MVKIYPVIGGAVSLIALILLSVGASTNRWVTLEQSEDELNPITTNTELGTRQASKLGVTLGSSYITYSVSQFGLWVGCHKEHKGAVSCAYIGSRCRSNVCWIRITTVSRTTTCMESRMGPIINCLAFQIVRAFTVIGLIFLLFGTCAQWVSLLTVKRSLAMLAGIVIFIAACLIIIAFAVFYAEIWQRSGLPEIGKHGYSFILFIISIPLAIFGGVISCIAASMGIRHKEVSDYSASNY